MSILCVQQIHWQQSIREYRLETGGRVKVMEYEMA